MEEEEEEVEYIGRVKGKRVLNENNWIVNQIIIHCVLKFISAYILLVPVCIHVRVCVPVNICSLSYALVYDFNQMKRNTINKSVYQTNDMNTSQKTRRLFMIKTRIERKGNFWLRFFHKEKK